METIIDQTIDTSYSKHTKTSLLKKIMNWCERQDSSRLLWLGVALTAHGCIVTPLTVMAVLLAGTNIFLFVLAIVTMGATLVTCLAAMPTKITLPVFILSTLIDILIVVSCLFIGLDIAKTYI